MFHLKDIVKAHGVTNIIGYVRKSRQDIEREKRTGEDTLSEQTTLMTGTLDSIELPYEMRMEIGSGDSISGRPIFQEVIKELESGKYQAVAVKELSRLSRGNMGDADRVINLLRDHRLLVITPTRIYDIRNTNDHRSIRFELFLAREEYEMIKERMAGARILYSQQGKHMSGKPPFGFSFNKRTQRLIPHEEQSETVKMIYDLFMNGLNGQEVSYQAIATYLTNMGIKTARGKKTWSYTQVKHILTNDVYKGVIKYRTHERNKNGKRIERPKEEHIYVEDAHEAIIDKEYWEKVQDKIRNKTPLPHNPLDFSPNELASVCVCSICGGKLIRNCQTVKYTKQDGSESIYVKEFLKCLKNNCMSVKYRNVEKAILRALMELKQLSDEELLKVVDQLVINEELNSKSVTREQMLKQIEQKEKELKGRMDFVYEQFETKIYTPEMFLERRISIENELEQLKQSKEELTDVKSKNSNVDLEKLRWKLGSIVDTYHSLSVKEKKNKLLRDMFVEVGVKITEKGRGRKASKFDIFPILRYKILETLEK